MFIVSITYTASLADVDKHLAAHREYLDRQYDAGIFIASGPKEPRNGGVILANTTSRANLDLVLAQDPFRLQNVAQYDVTEFKATKTAPELAFMRQ